MQRLTASCVGAQLLLHSRVLRRSTTIYQDKMNIAGSRDLSQIDKRALIIIMEYLIKFDLWDALFALKRDIPEEVMTQGLQEQSVMGGHRLLHRIGFFSLHEILCDADRIRSVKYAREALEWLSVLCPIQARPRKHDSIFFWIATEIKVLSVISSCSVQPPSRQMFMGTRCRPCM